MRVSLITTFYNEAASARRFFDGLASWQRLPDEIVMVDGGSTDDTVAVIRNAMAGSPVPVRLFETGGCNISEGRNMAVRNATGDVLASTDLGCVVEPEWLERLVGPFSDETIDVVSGYYEPVCRTPLQRAYRDLTDNPDLARAHWLPSSRSIAFRRRAWEAAGGYPEELTTAEDTVFDLRLRATGCREVFAPDARVRWEARDSLGAMYRQYFRYARGAGHGRVQPVKYGFYAGNYALFLLWLWLAAAGSGWFLLVLAAHAAGYSWLRIFRKRAVRRNLSAGNLARYLGITWAIDAGSIAGFAWGTVERWRGRGARYAPPDDRGRDYGKA